MSRKQAPPKARAPEPVDEDEEEDDIEEAQGGVVSDQLAELIRNRMGGLVGMPSGFAVNHPPEVKRRLNALKNLQTKHGELEAQFREEVLKLERKYHELFSPLYTRRTDIVTGKAEPTDEECEREVSDLEEEVEQATLEELDSNDKPVSKEPAKGVPEFWATVLRTHPAVNELIQPEDEDALKHLTDVRLRYTEDNHGFILEFVFEPNEYFTESVLTKTYYLENPANAGYDDLIYSHAEGCKISWKAGKNLTVAIETKKQRHKGTKKTRVVKREVPKDSFFRFFDPPKMPRQGEEDEEDVDPELQQALEQDFELGEIFKSRLIKHAVDWFTGKALEFEDQEEDYDYDDEGDEDEDDEGDEDEDDEDDDDEDDVPRGGRGGRGGARRPGAPAGGRPVPGGAQPQECNQQ